MNDATRESWWLATLGRTIVWARLREREAEDMMASLMQNHKICCFEVTEVNPTLDKENLMAEIAFSILQRSVNVLLVN